MENVCFQHQFIIRATLLFVFFANNFGVNADDGEISCTFGNEKNFERAMQDISISIINENARPGTHYCKNNIVCDGTYTNFVLCVDDTKPGFEKYMREIKYVKSHCDFVDSVCCNGSCTKQCRQSLCDTFINEYSELEYIPLIFFVVTFAWSYISYVPKILLPTYNKYAFA